MRWCTRARVRPKLPLSLSLNGDREKSKYTHSHTLTQFLAHFYRQLNILIHWFACGINFIEEVGQHTHQLRFFNVVVGVSLKSAAKMLCYVVGCLLLLFELLLLLLLVLM